MTTSTDTAAFRTTFEVTGMTCGHCVKAVTEELQALPGVTGVSVDLRKDAPSPVVVDADRALDRGLLAAAVQEAGYTLV